MVWLAIAGLFGLVVGGQTAQCANLVLADYPNLEAYNSPWVYFDYSVPSEVTVTCIGEGETIIAYPSGGNEINCPMNPEMGPDDYQTVRCTLSCGDDNFWSIQPPQAPDDQNLVWCTTIVVPGSIPTTLGPSTSTNTATSSTPASTTPETSSASTEDPCKTPDGCTSAPPTMKTSALTSTTMSSAPSTTSNPSSGGLSVGIIVLLSVLALVIVLFVAGLFFLLAVLRHRRRAASQKPLEHHEVGVANSTPPRMRLPPTSLSPTFNGKDDTW